MIPALLLLDDIGRRAPAAHVRKWHYYNDISAEACAWTRELIKMRLIPDGEVDNRSICDVSPSDLVRFVQCHFFSGVQGWPHALRLAGFPEDRECWTGSAPCQPWSAAGEGDGHADERHLWPVFYELIKACRPELLFGEQVSSAAVVGRSNGSGGKKVQGEEPLPWYPGIRADLEQAQYAVCGLDLPAACIGEDCEIGLLRGDQVEWERGRIGPPHIRQRLFWFARLANAGSQRRQQIGGSPSRDEETDGGARWNRIESDGNHQSSSNGESHVGGLPDTDCQRSVGQHPLLRAEKEPGRQPTDFSETSGSGKSDSWFDFQLVGCADGKARRIKSGLEPLVDGLPRGMVHGGDPREPGYAENTAEARRMRLSGYGNAIVPSLAAEFVETCMEVIGA